MKIYLFFITMLPESGLFFESWKCQYFLSDCRLLIGIPIQLIFLLQFD